MADSVNANARHWSFFTWLGYLVFTFIVVCVLLDVAAHVVLAVHPRFRKPTVTDTVPGSPPFAGFSWAADCIQDQRSRQKVPYVSYRLWGIAETHGNCINNDSTELGVVRRTVNPANPACANHRKVKIWVFGGSAAYGTLIPDADTLSSSLSRALNTSSRCVEVTNLGVEGYVSTQELLLLMEKLKTGHVPDVVVFFDGFNDADAGTSPTGPDTHLRYAIAQHRLESGLPTLSDFLHHLAIGRLMEDLTRTSGRTIARVPNDQLLARASATLNNYVENLNIARKLGELYGFKVCAFWQPAIMDGHKPLVPYEQQYVSLASTPAYSFESLIPIYQEAERRSQRDGRFVYLGDIFDLVPQPIYLDWVHLNPTGNELAARAIASHLQECLP